MTGEVLAGIGDLRALFAARKGRFYRGATEKLMTYALGRGLERYDKATVRKIAKNVALNVRHVAKSVVAEEAAQNLLQPLLNNFEVVSHN